MTAKRRLDVDLEAGWEVGRVNDDQGRIHGSIPKMPECLDLFPGLANQSIRNHRSAGDRDLELRNQLVESERLAIMNAPCRDHVSRE